MTLSFVHHAKGHISPLPESRPARNRHRSILLTLPSQFSIFSTKRVALLFGGGREIVTELTELRPVLLARLIPSLHPYLPASAMLRTLIPLNAKFPKKYFNGEQNRLCYCLK
jgi:hypothetical protein